MKKLLNILIYCALVPFATSMVGFAVELCGLSCFSVIAVPALTAVIYTVFRNKYNARSAAKVNGITFLMLLVCYTVMMVISSGNVEGTVMSCFSWLILPFTPVMFIDLLMGQTLLLYLTALLTYITAFAVTAYLGKIRIRNLLPPAAAAIVCVCVSVYMYSQSPALRYGGHGFEYMHGYSSTDFSDYMVYSEDSKLAVLDHAPELIIENADDMPIMDGAEACYPLYAAFAKAVYKDIDKIEKQYMKDTDSDFNGRIVTFTNTIFGFSRLLNGRIYVYTGPKPEPAKSPEGEETPVEIEREDFFQSGNRTDMFFGARPSASQLAEAEEMGVELDITAIGREAFVFFAEEDNPVNDLTSEQLRAIYHGDITNWSELGGEDREILAFQRPANSGSQTMMEYFMGDVSLKEPLTYETVDAMAGVIKEVSQYANEKGAIGYSFRYFLEGLNQEKGVKMLSVDGVYPSLENIENGSYPFIANVCLITRKNDKNPYVQKMKDFILSDDGQEIVRRTGYAGINR